MANNFRKTAARYISKAGNELNAGTNANEPKLLAISANLSSGAVIGTGHYIITATISNPGVVEGDGLVIIEASSTQTYLVTRNQQNYIWFKNFLTGLAFQIQGDNNASNKTWVGCTWENCIISEGVTSTSSKIITLRNCVFIDVVMNDGFQVNLYLENCILINSTIRNLTGMVSCYVDSNSVIKMKTTVQSADFNFNNIEGDIIMTAGNPTFDGLPLDMAAHQAAYPGFNASSFSDNPDFHDAADYDFNLALNSPNIKTGVAGQNIGPAQFFVATSAQVDQPGSVIDPTNPDATVTGLVESGGALVVDTPTFDQGNIISAPEQVAPFVATLKEIQYFGTLAFKAEAAGGSADNNNVPNAYPLTANYPATTPTTGTGASASELVVAEGLISIGDFVRVAGEVREVTNVVNATPNDTLTLASALRSTYGPGVDVEYGTEIIFAYLNPNRLKYYMRWSTKLAQPTVAGDWDNGGLIAAGSYALFEWFQPPQVDGAGRFNGEFDFDPTTASTIQAKWIQRQVFIIDTYRS